MVDVSGRILCVALAGLFLGTLAGVCFAEPDQTSSAVDSGARMEAERENGPMLHQDAGIPMGVPVDVLYSGRGFALRGDESHVLRLKVEALLPLEPGQIRGLLASNKSLEEIREDIQAREGEETYRGSLILDRSVYPVINIEAAKEGNSTALKADLADLDLLASASETAILGSIVITVSPSDGGMIGKGELNLSRGPQAGRYSVLLDMEPPRHGNGRGPAGMNR